MSRCLSERTLMRLIAGGGREAQRAHLAACDRCEARYRAIGDALDRVTEVLLHTEPPLRSAPLLARYWMPAIAAAVASLALLVWVEITVWRAVTPAQPEEVTAFLSDLSATMFSARGRAGVRRRAARAQRALPRVARPGPGPRSRARGMTRSLSARDALAAGDDGASGPFSADGLASGCPSDPLAILGCESDTSSDAPTDTYPERSR